MGVLRRRGKWIADFRVRGRRYQRVARPNTKAAAELLLAELRLRHASPGSTHTAETDKTLAEFVPMWVENEVNVENSFAERMNKKNYLRRHIVPFFGDYPLGAISRRDIDMYKAEKTRSGLKKKTINNQLGCLRRLLNAAAEWDLIRAAPNVKALKVPKPEIHFLEPSEQVQLLRAAADEPEWYACIVTSLYAGLRLGELRELRWFDLDLDRAEITVSRKIWQGHVGPPKGRTIERLPLSRSTVSALREQKKLTAQRGELVFSQPTGDRLSEWMMYDRLEEQCRAADIRRITWHTLRHSGATNLARAGKNEYQVQIWLRDKSTAMAARYVHLFPRDLREHVEAVEVSVDAEAVASQAPVLRYTHEDAQAVEVPF